MMQFYFVFNALVNLINEVIQLNQAPEDKIFNHYCKQYKIGSKNRRMLSNLFFDWLRHYWMAEEWIQKDPDALSLAEQHAIYLLQRNHHAEWIPAHLLPQILPNHTPSISAQANMEPSLWQEFSRSFDSELTALKEAQALLKEAFTDIRVNTFTGGSKSNVLRELCSLGIFVEDLPYSKQGVRLQKRENLQYCNLYQKGAFEIQDLGAQIVSILCDIAPNMRVLDYCAGAGGKSLAFLNVLKNTGELVLSDINETRLNSAKKRIQRIENFSATNVGFLPIDQIQGRFDRVVVDAPCSGIGTLRRNPGRVLHLTKADIDGFADQQIEILERAAQYIKPDGWLIYITCSLLNKEDEEVANRFLTQHSDFIAVPLSLLWTKHFKQLIPVHQQKFEPFLKISPKTFQTDGFFMAIFRRK